MFTAILLSQFRPWPGITMGTDDVITATDDVIHTICIVLEGKVMCCNKVACFMKTNSLLQIYFLELHMEILMQQLLHSNKNMLLVKVSLLKIISLKAGSWLQSCKMTGHEGACFDYTFLFLFYFIPSSIDMIT